MSGPEDYVPPPGAVVKDTEHARVGIARAWDGKTLTLQDPAGEGTWDTGHWERPDQAERIKAGVAQENYRARQALR